MSRTPLIAGNWKMHGSRAEVDSFARRLQPLSADTGADLLICAPFIYLERLAAALANAPVAVGGQNLAAETGPGAFTGEISGAMLADVGCSHVIIGHSERRVMYGESDATVAGKVAAATAAGLEPILCVGETLEQRDAGQAEAVLQRQLQAVIDASDARTLAALTIAYEPVWAIGTGRSADPDQVQEMHALIREQIAATDVTISRLVRLLYGGSVKPGNAVELLCASDVDGALVGGASLEAASFMDIARVAG